MNKYFLTKNLLIILSIGALLISITAVYDFLIIGDEAQYKYQDTNKTYAIKPNKSIQRLLNKNGFNIVEIHYTNNKKKSISTFSSKTGFIPIEINSLNNAKSIRLLTQKAEQQHIDDCYYTKGMRLVLLDTNLYIDSKDEKTISFEIASFNKYLPLYWNSISQTLYAPQKIEYKVLNATPNIVEVETNKKLEDGLFLQNNNIVGWAINNKYYLWIGENEHFINPNIKLNTLLLELKNAELNEKISNILKDKNINDSSKLNNICTQLQIYQQDYKDSFRIPNEIITPLKQLVNTCWANNNYYAIVNSLNNNLLYSLSDTEVMEIYADSIKQIYGFGYAIKELYKLKDSFPGNSMFYNSVNKKLLNLYIEWLIKLEQNREYSAGLDVFSLAHSDFKSNPELNIRGLAFLVYEEKWNEANEVIKETAFPAQYLSTIKMYQNIIDENIYKESTVLINFQNTDNNIVVETLLNNSVKQKFIVDTGATITTIPKRTAEQLGIRYSKENFKNVATASGTVIAYETILKSITINNKTFQNVNVLILDLPNHPDYGLLGLNFLKQFKVKIDHKQGTMFLEVK